MKNQVPKIIFAITSHGLGHLTANLPYCYLGTPNPIVPTKEIAYNDILDIWGHAAINTVPSYTMDIEQYKASQVPEPTAIILLGSGLKGFSGAFVVAFRNGKRIPVRQAQRLLN